MGEEDQSRRARVESEAAEWLARLEAGSADVEAFERWRSADAAHATAFAQLDAAWARLDRVRAVRPPGAPNPDLFAPSKEDETAPSRRWLLRAAMFGGVAVLAGGAATVALTGRASAETGIGERRAVRLPDGSLLDLNTNSRASWRFTDAARQVWLERGEAAIEIARDAATRPFVLAAAGRAVPLNDGVFNARLRGNEAEIVRLRDANADVARAEAASIAEGEQILISAGHERVEPLTPAAADAAGAWRRGEIIFDGDTLGEAVAEYNRYLTRPIEIGDEDIASLRLGGRFTTRDPAEFIEATEAAFGVTAVRRNDGTIVLNAAESSNAD